jgi:hypothetical protein
MESTENHNTLREASTQETPNSKVFYQFYILCFYNKLDFYPTVILE